MSLIDKLKLFTNIFVKIATENHAILKTFEVSNHPLLCLQDKKKPRFTSDSLLMAEERED